MIKIKNDTLLYKVLSESGTAGVKVIGNLEPNDNFEFFMLQRLKMAEGETPESAFVFKGDETISVSVHRLSECE